MPEPGYIHPDPAGEPDSDPQEAPGMGAGAMDPEDSRFWQAFGEATGRFERDGATALPHAHDCLEWCPICRGADLLRATTTPEMREQWQGIQRDALVTLRALLDAYIERLEAQGRDRGVEVEDIPIE